MKVWIFQTGEPLHIDTNLTRPMRAMNLANFLTMNAHEVTIWTSSFYHQSKEHRYSKFKSITTDYLNLFADHNELSNNLSELSRVSEQVQSIEDRFNRIISDSNSPWDIEVRLVNWEKEANGNIFRFDYKDSNELNQHRATWDTLSFGQKSNFILTAALVLEESINNEEPEWPLQRFTVIDEPEAGKAESWVSSLINELSESSLRLESRKNSSVMILSHRGIVLDSISDDGTYSLLHDPGKIEYDDE